MIACVATTLSVRAAKGTQHLLKTSAPTANLSARSMNSFVVWLPNTRIASASHLTGCHLRPFLLISAYRSISTFACTFSMLRMVTGSLPQNTPWHLTRLVMTPYLQRFAVDCVNPRDNSGILQRNECPALSCPLTMTGPIVKPASTVRRQLHRGLIGEVENAGNHDMHRISRKKGQACIVAASTVLG